MIIEKSGIKYHHILLHIPCILRKWGFRQKVPRKVLHVNTASKEEKMEFKKRHRTNTCGCSKPLPTTTT